jgi:hypothetical protein
MPVLCGIAAGVVGILLVTGGRPGRAGAVQPPPAGRLTVTGYGVSAMLLTQVRRDAAAALRYVRGVWDGPWSTRVVVEVPADDAGFHTRLGRGSADGEAAVALIPRAGPAGAPGQGAARVIINTGVYERLTAEGRQVVLRHEMTHLASADVTSSDTPSWLVEGLAETVGHAGTALAVTAAATELAAAVRTGWLPDALPADAAFTATDGTVPRSYQEAWLACKLIADTVGLDRLIGFYRQVGTGPGDLHTRLADGFQMFLATTEAGFVTWWRAYLRVQVQVTTTKPAAAVEMTQGNMARCRYLL